MRKSIMNLLIGILVGTICTGGIVFAKSTTEYIEVIYDNIKIYKDNVLCELKDANGGVVEPFIYNGTTYMPVRGTANLADMEVTWNGATKSVYLWDEIPADNTYLLDICPPYETKNYDIFLQQKGQSFQMSGTKYSNGFTLGKNGYALFNLDSKYSNIAFDVGRLDGSDMESGTISFFLDGKMVKEIEISAEDMPKTVSLDTKYALQLKVMFVPNRLYPKVGFGNITVK